VRWGALATIAAGVVAALSAAHLAPGQTIDRVRVAPSPPVASVPDGLTLVIGSPDAYSRLSASGARGTWIGPGYAPLGAPNAWGNATIDWEVGFDARPMDSERVALANLTRDWQEDQRAGVSIPHVVGGRVVGDIPGFFVLQVERQSAPGELVVAFPLSRDLHAYVRFLLTRPESNDFSIGSIRASSWNRGQAFVAMARVKLEGNLPPSLVSIRGRRGGRVISGFVLDFLRHAVVGIPVTLERQVGNGWRPVARARTTRLGGYTFNVARRGSYRARATMGSRFSATSRLVRIRAAR
jgi:hypothetical protein